MTAGRARTTIASAAVVLSMAFAAAPAAAQLQPIEDGTASSTVPAAPANDEVAEPGALDPVTDPGAVDAEVIAAVDGEQLLAREDRKLVAVVGGLVAIAFAIALLTIRYVRVTKPVPPVEGAAGDAGPPADEAVAPLAGAGASEPAPVVVPAPAPGASEGGAVADDEPIFTSAFEPSTGEVPATDHGGADSDYEPHGTGEHERVELPPGPTLARPGLGDRAATLARTAP